jgi:hypothetical protein
MAWFVYAMRIMWPVNGITEAQLISFASTLEETRSYCETGTNFRLVGLKNILGSADFWRVELLVLFFRAKPDNGSA